MFHCSPAGTVMKDLYLGIDSKENFAKQAGEFGADSNLFKKYFPSATDSESIASQISFKLWIKPSGCPNIIWALKQNENSSVKNISLPVHPETTGNR